MLKNYIFLISVIILFIFSGCGGGNELIQLSLKCDNNTNGGNAIVVTVYQLTNGDKFQFSGFESLTQNPEAVLGTDLIVNSKFEKTMVPGEVYSLDELEVKGEALFLGIVADFHSPSPDGWKQLIPLAEEFDHLIISVHENSITVATED